MKGGKENRRALAHDRHPVTPIAIPFVPVPKDLTRVKTKVALNLTKRQLICFGCAAGVGIPTYLLTRTALGSEAAVLLMMGLMLPFFFLAMYEKDGQPAEKILLHMLRARFWPGTRPYKTENLYQFIDREGEAFADKNKAADQPGAAAASRKTAGKNRSGRSARHAEKQKKA